MFRERNASARERRKLTIKFTKPIIPIPTIPQNRVGIETSKLLPNKPSAKFPLAKVMCRMSKFNPKNTPMIAVDPMNTPNHKFEAIPGQFCSMRSASFLVFCFPIVFLSNGCSAMR